MVGTIKVGKLQAADGTSDTISIESGDKISGAAGSLSIRGVVVQIQNATLAGGANTTTSTSFVDTGLTCTRVHCSDFEIIIACPTLFAFS